MPLLDEPPRERSAPAGALDAETSLHLMARRRARAKLGWFLHAGIYLMVNLGLIAVSVATHRSWAIFPLLGWGAGLFFHGLSVWLLAPCAPLVERMVERERAALRAARSQQP